MSRRLHWLVGAAALLWLSAASAQLFQSQGPGPRSGPVASVQSADAPPNGGTEAGAIQAILPDPALGANTIFAGATNGGIFVTTNGGTTWTALTDKQASLSIASLGLDPTDPTGKTIIAGVGLTSNGLRTFSGLDARGGPRTGLLYTTDGGTSWSALGNTALAGQSVVGVAARGSTILAATFEMQAFTVTTASSGAYGLYRSVDGGANFGRVGALPGPVTSLVADPTNPSRFYAAVTSVATPNQTSVYVSPDAGATWSQVFTQANSAGTISSTQQTVLTLAAGPNGSVAVGVSNVSGGTFAGTFSGLFLSQDSGGTWHQLTAAPNVVPGGQTPVNLHIAIDPNNTNIVYLGGDAYQTCNNTPATSLCTLQAFRVVLNPNDQSSTATSLTFEGDPAKNFADASTIHADSRAMAFDASGRLLFSSDGGIYVRNNPQGAGTWQGLNGNLTAFEPYNVAFDANSKRLVIANQDNGVSLQSAPGSKQFDAINLGDGINAVINDRTLTSQSAIYTSFQNLGGLSRMVVNAQGKVVSPFPDPAGNPGGVPIYCNGGHYCANEVTGSNFSSQFVLNRIDPTMIAIGGSRVYITRDLLADVNATSIDLTLTDLGGTGASVSAIAYGTRDNVDALVAGNGNGRVFRATTANIGSIQQLVGYHTAGGDVPTSIVFDPRTSQRFFVADFTNLWWTQNGAAPTAANVTFQSLTANLPAGFIRPMSVEFISNNGVNALLVGGQNSPLTCTWASNGCVIGPQQSPITVADSDGNGNLSGWRAFGQGLPNTMITQLVYNPAVDVLATAAVGRGAFVLYDATSNFIQATVLQFGLADNDSAPGASILTDGTVGSRPLIKYGTGTLTITGEASYTGGTTILGGALVLGNGGASGSILGDVVDNGILAFNRSDAFTFGGVISGTGSVMQVGTGTTILTAVNSYTGPTYVLGGTLSVNGSIASSPVFVDVGGTLGGNGVVGPTTILPGGVVAPGNSVGTLTVAGNLVLSAASLYLVEVQSNASDRLVVTGTASLAGTVGVSYLGGNLAHSYTILSASGGRTGTFDSVISLNLPAFIAASLGYTSTDVQLSLTSGLGQIAGLSRNQSAVAAPLDSTFNSGGGALLNLFGVPASQLPAALDMLSGEGVSATQETALSAAGTFTSIMMNQGTFWRIGDSLDINGVALSPEPLQYAPSRKPKAEHPAFKAIAAPKSYQPRWRAWATAFDGSAKLAGEASTGSASLSRDIGGLAGGLDYQLTPDLLLGVAIGGSSSNFSVRDRITSGHLEAAHLGGYGVKTWGAIYASGALGVSTFRNSTTRIIAGVGPTETATGSFGSNLVSARLEMGSKQAFGRFALTPFAAIQFAALWQNGFTETNPVPAGAPGPAGLSYASTRTTSLPIFVGSQFDSRFVFGNGMTLAPYARLSWVHEFYPDRAIGASFIALPGAAFTVDGPRAARDAVRVDAGAKLAIRQNAWLFASFDGEYSHRSQSYAGKAGVRVAW